MLRLVRAVKQAGRGFARNVFCLKMRSIAGNGKEQTEENSGKIIAAGCKTLSQSYNEKTGKWEFTFGPLEVYRSPVHSN